MNPNPKLLAAAQILETKGWTQGSLARSADGRPVHVRHPEASCFCVLGALNLAGGGPPELALLAQVLPDGSIVSWNDDPSQTARDVIAHLKAAAELEA